MEALGYDILLSDPWLPYTMAVGGFSLLVSIIAVRLSPNKPWVAFFQSCLAAFIGAYVASGVRTGFSGGGEAIFWNVLGAVLFAPIWLPATAVIHVILRRDLIRRR